MTNMKVLPTSRSRARKASESAGMRMPKLDLETYRVAVVERPRALAGVRRGESLGPGETRDFRELLRLPHGLRVADLQLQVRLRRALGLCDGPLLVEFDLVLLRERQHFLARELRRKVRSHALRVTFVLRLHPFARLFPGGHNLAGLDRCLKPPFAESTPQSSFRKSRSCFRSSTSV